MGGTWMADVPTGISTGIGGRAFVVTGTGPFMAVPTGSCPDMGLRKLFRGLPLAVLRLPQLLWGDHGGRESRRRGLLVGLGEHALVVLLARVAQRRRHRRDRRRHGRHELRGSRQDLLLLLQELRLLDILPPVDSLLWRHGHHPRLVGSPCILHELLRLRELLRLLPVGPVVQGRRAAASRGALQAWGRAQRPGPEARWRPGVRRPASCERHPGCAEPGDEGKRFAAGRRCERHPGYAEPGDEGKRVAAGRRALQTGGRAPRPGPEARGRPEDPGTAN